MKGGPQVATLCKFYYKLKNKWEEEEYDVRRETSEERDKLKK